MFHFADIMEVHPPELIFPELAANHAEGGSDGSRIQNWLQMLNLGYRIPGVVNTDAHYTFHGSGWLRNYIKSSTDDPGEADLMEICHALERGQIVMTSGPFMEVKASAGGESVGPGDDLIATTGMVQLHVRVECPNWFDVNRVQVFINGRADGEYNFVRGTDRDTFSNSSVKFDSSIEIPLNTDAHIIVAACSQGRPLGRVYGSEAGKNLPGAVSNPIFVDTQGDGFQANGDLLDLPLPVLPDHKPTHGHDHYKPVSSDQ